MIEELHRKSLKSPSLWWCGCVESLALVWCGSTAIFSNWNQSLQSQCARLSLCSFMIFLFALAPVVWCWSSIKGEKTCFNFLFHAPSFLGPKWQNCLPFFDSPKRKKPKRPNLGLVNSETFARCFKLTYFSPFSCMCLYISVWVQTHTKWLLKNSAGTLHSCCGLGESWSQGWVVCRNSKSCYR